MTQKAPFGTLNFIVLILSLALGCFLLFKGFIAFKEQDIEKHVASLNKNYGSQASFEQYFNTLSKRADKDWALAVAAVYCKQQMAEFAIAHGADPDLQIEVVANYHVLNTHDRWAFINGENWKQYKGAQFVKNTKNYVPFDRPKSIEMDCKCEPETRSMGVFSVDELLEKCNPTATNLTKKITEAAEAVEEVVENTVEKVKDVVENITEEKE